MGSNSSEQNLNPNRKRHEWIVKEFVLGLFKDASRAIFVVPGEVRKDIDDFIQSKDVIEATCEYIKALQRIYNQQHPDQKLKINPRFHQNTSIASAEDSQSIKKTRQLTEPETTSDSLAQTTKEQALEKAEPTAPSPQKSPTDQFARSSVVNPLVKPGCMPRENAVAGKPLQMTASFQMPNAKVGVAYFGKIEGRDAMGDSVRVRDPKLPQELGLTFDEARAEVKGTPTVSGEYAFNLQWSSDGSSWHTGECLLFVNPDPRSLWKCLEPSQDEPYQKSHTDSAIVTAPTYKIVAASRRGRSHEHSGTFRDDDFYLAHDSNSNWSVMIVADGAGSAKSSRWGSKLAVHAFGEYLQFELAGDVGQKFSAALAAGWSTDDQSTGEIGSMFHKLFLHAGKLALKAIEVEAQKKGAQLKDYSTTLLAAVMRQDEGKLFLSTFWIGDGAIAVYGPRGKVRLMGTPDGGEYAGQTRFLDWAALEDKGSAKRVGIGRFPNIKGLLLMTDGVSDPRFETDTGLADASLWDSLWDEIDPLLKSENPDAAMVDWLHFFTSGHHDDRTIAVLCVAEPTP